MSSSATAATICSRSPTVPSCAWSPRRRKVSRRATKSGSPCRRSVAACWWGETSNQKSGARQETSQRERTMPNLTRRTLLQGTAALGGAAFATRVVSAAPAAEPVTDALIEAAKKEGKVAYYTSIDLPVAEKIAKAFEAKYPGITVRTERSGAERIFQRIGQESASNIHACDVVNSSDAAHFIVWKRDGLLAPYLSEEVAKHYPPEHKDADAMFASFRVTLSPIARSEERRVGK